jgi:hypothetical protein
MSPDDPIAGSVKLSRPAHRALVHAGIVSFVDLAAWTQKDVAALHGIGPASFPQLHAALEARGLRLREA